MRRRQMWLVLLFSAAILVAAHDYARKAWATPAIPGYKGTTLYFGTLQEFEVFNHATKKSLPAGFDGNVWLSLQKTKGASDLYIQSNTWAPVTMGVVASTGWHTHLSHTLIIVTAGAVTEYKGDDPSCTPHVYTAGMTFIERGGTHVHIVRNEGTVEAQVVAVRLIPAGQPGRIDAPDPGNCHF